MPSTKHTITETREYPSPENNPQPSKHIHSQTESKPQLLLLDSRQRSGRDAQHRQRVEAASSANGKSTDLFRIPATMTALPRLSAQHGEHMSRSLQVRATGLHQGRAVPLGPVDRVRKVLGFDAHGVVPSVRLVGGICGATADEIDTHKKESRRFMYVSASTIYSSKSR